MRRDRKQSPGVEASGEEAEVSRMSISWMAIIRLSSLEGSVIQVEEQANRIKEGRGFMEEKQLNCPISSTIIQREIAPVAVLYRVLLWEFIQADAVKETRGNLGIVVTEDVVREERNMR